MSAGSKAKNVAESVQAHGLDMHEPATWERYGVRPESDLGRLILQAYSEFGKKKSPYGAREREEA